MRIIAFVDGASSETTPTIGNIKASDLTTHVDDAAYEAANAGAPTEGNLYSNTTLNVIRYYDGASWNTIQSTSEKGAANGYASLDGSGLVPVSQLPALVSDLSDLSDVDTTGVANGEVLTFNSGSGEWEPAASAGGSGDLWSDPVDADIVPDAANTRDYGTLAKPFEQGFTDNIFVTNGGTSVNGSLTTGNNNLLVNSFRVRTEINLPITLQTANDSADDAVATSNVYILSGNKTDGSGGSGNIINQTGSSDGGARGSIIHKDGSESGAGAGAVWTQAAADGVGGWAAPASGGDLWSDPVDANIIPDGAGTRGIGSPSAQMANVWGTSFLAVQGAFTIRSASSNILQISENPGTVPSGKSKAAGIALDTTIAGNFAIFTPTKNNSSNLLIETGAGTAGNSGNIEATIGTATGTQGEFKFLKAGNAPSVSDVWTATDADGSGYWAAPAATGANTALSNLASTNINTNLVPGTNKFLGDISNSWGRAYITSIRDGSDIVMDVSDRTLKNSSNATTMDFTTRIDCSMATAPFRSPNLSADPGAPLNGDIWYNTTTNELKTRVNGVTVVLA